MPEMGLPPSSPAEQTQDPRVRHRQIATIALLVVAGCISYADRTAFSLGGTAIMAEMHVSYAIMGLLLSAFSWAYLVGQIPAGILADRISPRILLGAGLVAWSCAQIASGFATSVHGLMLARIGLGLGEAPLFLSGTRALVAWFRPEERGRPIGLFNGAAALGPAIAPPALLAIMAVGGWRSMLVFAGLASLALSVLWLVYYRDPFNMSIEAFQPPPEQRSSVARPLRTEFTELLTQRSTWAITTGYMGVIYLTWLFATWMPTWLEQTHRLSAAEAGLLSALPQLCGFFGSLAGGVSSDRLSARGFNPVNACRILITIAMLTASGATGFAIMPLPLSVTVILICIALFCGGVAMTCGWTLGTLVTSEDKVATLEAIQNTGASLGGALAPAVTGILVEHTGSFTPSLLVAAVVGVSSAAIYFYALPSGRHTHPAIINRTVGFH